MMKIDLVQRIHLVDQPGPSYFAARKGLYLNSEIFLHFWFILENLSSKDMRVLVQLDGLVVSITLIFELSGFLYVLLHLLSHFR